MSDSKNSSEVQGAQVNYPGVRLSLRGDHASIRLRLFNTDDKTCNLLRLQKKLGPSRYFLRTAILCSIAIVYCCNILRSHDTIYSNPSEPCALLFFGLMKEFKSTVLPSIERNILQHNPHCDVYLHTFNITEVPINPRSSELQGAPTDISEAFLLTAKDHIVFEPMESFDKTREHVMHQTRKNYHHGWGSCCISHDNMIKQWHSIQGVWDLMNRHEKARLKGPDGTTTTQNVYYKQIGLFRSDVYYTDPIHIFDSNAATANFALHNGYNDRFFYGSREYAETWASKRFDFIPIFEKDYMIPFNKVKGKQKDGYHSETYVKRLLDHYSVPVEKKNICVWRVRSGPRIKVMDCLIVEGGIFDSYPLLNDLPIL